MTTPGDGSVNVMDLEVAPMKSLNHRGFVMPVVLFSLLLMSTVAMVALTTSGDELQSTRAMRQSTSAFYAAEAGLNKTIAEWDSATLASVSELEPGDSTDLGWTTLNNGASYRVVVHRWDTGDQPIYTLTTEGRGLGVGASQRRLTYVMTAEPSGGGAPSFGYCCEAGVTIRGDIVVDDDNTGISGLDQHPPGWEDGGACGTDLEDKPGVLTDDDSLIDIQDTDAYITGDPPIVEDPTIGDHTFMDLGPDLTWNDVLSDHVDHEVGVSDDDVSLNGSDVYPRYNDDGSCDTSHPYNWGSDDPSDPCFDYFPVILIKGEVALEELYGQAIFILEWDESTSLGSELEFQYDSRFAGVVLGKGCVEIQDNARVWGSVFVDANYYNPGNCASDGDAALDMSASDNQFTEMNWSSCAVSRALTNSGLAEAAGTGGGEGSGEPVLLSERAFTEIY